MGCRAPALFMPAVSSRPAIVARMQKTTGKATTHTSPNTCASTTDSHAQQFIARWQGVALTAATELSISQTFVLELCTLLGVPTPLPTDALDYVFERPITFAHGDGSTSPRPHRLLPAWPLCVRKQKAALRQRRRRVQQRHADGPFAG